MYGLLTECAAFQRKPLYEGGQCLEGEREEPSAALWLKGCDQAGEKKRQNESQLKTFPHKLRDCRQRSLSHDDPKAQNNPNSMSYGPSGTTRLRLQISILIKMQQSKMRPSVHSLRRHDRVVHRPLNKKNFVPFIHLLHSRRFGCRGKFVSHHWQPLLVGMSKYAHTHTYTAVAGTNLAAMWL